MQKKTVFGNQTARPKSDIHLKTLEKLKRIYAGFTILEEQTIKVRDQGRETNLFVDLLVRDINLCIECHGRQHFEFVAHFHRNKGDFEKQQRLDKAKEEAIESAGYTLLVVRYDEYEKQTDNQLVKAITKAIKESK